LSGLGFNRKASRILKGEGIVSIAYVDKSHLRWNKLRFAATIPEGGKPAIVVGLKRSDGYWWI
jgi:hypothetical protein